MINNLIIHVNKTLLVYGGKKIGGETGIQVMHSAWPVRGLGRLYSYVTPYDLAITVSKSMSA